MEKGTLVIFKNECFTKGVWAYVRPYFQNKHIFVDAYGNTCKFPLSNVEREATPVEQLMEYKAIMGDSVKQTFEEYEQ